MTPEDLALWYFRLNGFFTLRSFVVHPLRSGGALTEVDVAGVRLPHRREFPPGDGGDDAEVTAVDGLKPLALLVEVKSSECNLNGPWVADDPTAAEKLLGDLGLVPADQTPVAAAALRQTAEYSDSSITIRLTCVGRAPNVALRERYPVLVQRTWREAIQFIYERFRAFRRVKTDNRHWGSAGFVLWQAFESSRSPEEFSAHICSAFRVNAA